MTLLSSIVGIGEEEEPRMDANSHESDKSGFARLNAPMGRDGRNRALVPAVVELRPFVYVSEFDASDEEPCNAWMRAARGLREIGMAVGMLRHGFPTGARWGRWVIGGWSELDRDSIARLDAILLPGPADRYTPGLKIGGDWTWEGRACRIVVKAGRLEDEVEARLVGICVGAGQAGGGGLGGRGGRSGQGTEGLSLGAPVGCGMAAGGGDPRGPAGDAVTAFSSEAEPAGPGC